MYRRRLLQISAESDRMHRAVIAPASDSKDPSLTELMIGEHIRDDGSACQTRLIAREHGFEMSDNHGLRTMITAPVIVAVMQRYGRPLADDVVMSEPALPLDAGMTLRHLRYRAQVDASARDYIVLCANGQPPLAALSSVVTGALRFLATRASQAESAD